MAFMMTFDREIVERALKRAEELGVLKNSVTNGKGNVTGFIGEECFEKWMHENGVNVQLVDTYEYDFVAPNNLKIEVKTKKRGVDPRPNFANSVMCFNDRQKTDVYVFLQIVWTIPLHKGKCYFLGIVDAATFREKSTIQRAGVRTASGYVPRATNRYMSVSQCGDATELLYRTGAPDVVGPSSKQQ